MHLADEGLILTLGYRAPIDGPSIWAAYPRLVELMRDNVQNYIYNPLDFTGVFPFYPISLKK